MLSVLLLSKLTIKQLICGNNLNLLLNLNLIYETFWTGVRSGLLISMLRKLSWFRLTSLITMVLLMWKWIGSVLEEKSSFMIWSWPFLNWIGVLILSLLLKLSPRKFDLWCVLWSFFLLRLFCISISLPYAHLWNTVVTSGLVPLVATWNCEESYKKRYAELLVLHLLLLLNPLLIVEMWPA